MTLSEFKAWFKGYTEDMEDAPTKKQWKRIKARVKEIDGQTVTERVYLDRYLPTWPRRYDLYWGHNTGGMTTDKQPAGPNIIYNSTSAMTALGAADALADAA